MGAWSTVRTYERTEFGVRMHCHVMKGGWTEIVATGGYTDRPSIFDHTAFSGRDAELELRKALRRHARLVKRESE